ncbi:MAG: thioesterase family protein [Trueperaceae bacterium]|nr:thioesterase family protein [Trueperaceae bacterium]
MELRVRFAETDQIGIAHHAAYVVWLEAARVEWLRALDLRYRDLEDQGVSLAVTAVDVRYRQALRFDDRVRIDVVLEEARSRRLRFGYRVVQLADDAPAEDAAIDPVARPPGTAATPGPLAATAATVHVPTDRRGVAQRLPSAWLAAIAPHVGGGR